jgi:EmrB/QacA subfamily drug resistance transporter
VLDVSIVTVALPSMRHDLNMAPDLLPWVLNAYALPFGGFLLVGGRLADHLGPRPVFLSGLLIFALASLAAGLAPVAWALIAARAAQGLGAAALSPAALALLSGLFPSGPRRAWALGISGATAALGYTVGTALGGLLTDLLDWRWVFFAGVPVALAAAVATPKLIPSMHQPQRSRQLDVLGALAVTIGLTAILYPLASAAETGWNTTLVGVVGSGILILAGFAAIEARTPAPLVPLGFFGVRAVAVANAAAFLKSTVGVANIYVPTLYFQRVLGYSPLVAGLAFLPAGITAVPVGVLAGHVLHRLGGVKRTLVFALTVQLLGMLLMTGTPEHGAWPVLLLGMLVEVIGYVVADVALALAALADPPPEQRGLAAGVLRAGSQVGAVIGLAVISAVVLARETTLGGVPAGPGALLGGLQAGLLAGAALTLVALLVVLLGLPRAE